MSIKAKNLIDEFIVSEDLIKKGPKQKIIILDTKQRIKQLQIIGNTGAGKTAIIEELILKGLL